MRLILGYIYFVPSLRLNSSDDIIAYSLMTLVHGNKSNFTTREVKMVDRARTLYMRIRWPGYRRYLHAISNSSIIQYPVTIDDIKRSLQIYGLDAVGLKGKKIHKRSELIGVMMENIPLPPETYEHHQVTMISVEYVFVHGLCHLHLTLRGYDFRSMEYIPAKKTSKKYSKKEVKSIIKVFIGDGLEYHR